MLPLLAMGLFNTLNAAKQEEKLERRDSLLEELRELARVYPADPTVRERLAKCLLNTLVDAKQEEQLERRDSLLEELRELARVYPADPTVREQLAKGLFNTLNDAKQEEQLERRDSLLEELRKLARVYPNRRSGARTAGDGPVQHAGRCQAGGEAGAVAASSKSCECSSATIPTTRSSGTI